MGNCLPGSPCYSTQNAYTYATFSNSCNCGCNNTNCATISSENIYYKGAILPNTGMINKEILTVALQKIDQKLDPISLITLIVNTLNTNPVLKAALCTALSDCP